ncbi:purple acid phosphatase family protein [Saccharothrix australiensis]|uniref:Calcineurin-like phosphoesterase family protein n=1 Tax=Saccharothrix australiensis TaxID=2072 RepID=A0A495W1Y4_9PSEU|nr:metallophosphoesterase family protein [Saccharothrix australiensis]RKT55701.1 calcineurin-like phosphoesterase family protein [Saccharothrix australiensis]
MSSQQPRRGARRRPRTALAAAVLGSVVAGVLALPGTASADADTPDVSRLILTPTATPADSQSFTWRSTTAGGGTVQVRPVGGAPVDVAATAVDTSNLAGVDYVHYSATATGLTADTAYEYRVGGGERWSRWRPFRSAAKGAKPFEFLYYGDAQIGLDSTWPAVVAAANAKAPRSAGSVHAGDLIDSSNQVQWTSWFNGMGESAATTQVLAAPGNHEYTGDGALRNWKMNFEYPANHPGPATIGALAERAKGDTDAARQTAAYFAHWENVAKETVYYSDFQDVRFITLNATQNTGYLRPPTLPSCAVDCPSPGPLWVEFQAAWLDHVLTANPNKWSVVTFHQPVYSTSTGRDEPVLRANWVPVFQKHNVDLVLMGHDHTYARGYNNTNATDAPGTTNGPVYAVSNSGAKHYTLAPAGDNVWTRNGATQVKRGQGVTTYQVVSVNGDTVTYRSYVAEKKADSPEPEQVGDLFDSFTITKRGGVKHVTEAGVEPPSADDEQRIKVTVPERAPGELVWSIDGGNGVVDLGTAKRSGDHYAATGSLNPVRVTDTRVDAPRWSLSGRVGDFTSAGKTFSGKYLGWSPFVGENGGDAVAGAAVASGFLSGNGLAESATLGSAPVGHAEGSSVLRADLDLRLPVTVADGTYHGTLTLTALG